MSMVEEYQVFQEEEIDDLIKTWKNNKEVKRLKEEIIKEINSKILTVVSKKIIPVPREALFQCDCFVFVHI